LAVDDLGVVTLRNAATEKERSVGIDAFRRQFWLVAAVADPSPSTDRSNA
jgi:hypothetical protein